MAITTLSPDPCNTPAIGDLVSLKEARLLFQESGIRAPETTLSRWVKEDRLHREWRGKKAVVSFSDLLESYTRRHPAPGMC